MAQCKATTPSGEPCHNQAPAGAAYCIWHDETRTQEAAEARKRGGLNRATEAGEFPGSINSMDDLLRGLNALYRDAWVMTGGERRIRSVAAVLKLANDILPNTVQDQKLAELEALIINGQKSKNTGNK